MDRRTKNNDPNSFVSCGPWSCMLLLVFIVIVKQLASALIPVAYLPARGESFLCTSLKSPVDFASILQAYEFLVQVPSTTL